MTARLLANRSAADLAPWLRRWAILAADQGLSSVGNFFVVLIAARLLGPAGLGSVVRALAVAYFTLALLRAICGEPLLVFGTRVLGGAVYIGLIVGLTGSVAAAALYLLPFWERDPAIGAVSLMLVGVCMQDLGRYVSFTLRRPGVALAADAIWILVELAVLAILVYTPLSSAAGVVLAWGAGAAAGALFVFAWLGLRPTRGSAVAWLRETRGLSSWATGQAVLSQVAGPLMVFGLGAVAGLSVLGGIRAAQTLLSPLTGGLATLFPLLLPGSRPQGGPVFPQISARVRAAAALCFAVGTVYAGTVAAFADVISTVFGSAFGAFAGVVPAVALAGFVQALAIPPGVGTRALGAGWALFATQAAATAVGLPVILVLGATHGAGGAAAGLAVQSGVLCLASWFTFAKEFRSATRVEIADG